MSEPIFYKIALNKPLHTLFDYLAPPGVTDLLLPGQRVKVPFGKQEIVGIVVSSSHSTEIPPGKCKPILAVLDAAPLLPPETFSLCQFATQYYHHPLGEVLFHALPPSYRKAATPRRAKALALTDPQNTSPTTTSPPPLTKEQQVAISEVKKRKGTFSVSLLEGITGSGKTEIYLSLTQWLLEQQKQVLILVPEIGLTPQTTHRFASRFPCPIALLHSGLTPSEKNLSFEWARTGHAPILIGTRSAIFTPLPHLGGIIVDEEHDLSFKQQEGFRYHARDLAVIRGQQAGCPVILGSATPSFETLHNATIKKYHHLRLTTRPGKAKPPQFELIDTRNKKLTGGFSQPLLKAIQTELSQDRQVLIFLNRRGYAPILLCHQCGWIAQCSHCDAKFTLHQRPQRLHCHHCDRAQPAPARCGSCQGDHLVPVGLGTERIEQIITEKFPSTPLTRMDSDTTRLKGSLQKHLQDIAKGGSRILIGTQMLAKGHDFPHLTLVAIVDGDGALFSSDFRANERSAQLLLQVAGRAGRSSAAGNVLIQTRNPHHPFLTHLLKEGYHAFAQLALQERAAAALPPNGFLALLRAEGAHPQLAKNYLDEAKATLLKHLPPGVHAMGPIPAPMEKRGGRFRAQLLIQSPGRAALQAALAPWAPELPKLQGASKIRWSLDVDPMELF